MSKQIEQEFARYINMSATCLAALTITACFCAVMAASTESRK